MYVGGTDIKALHHLVYEVVDNAIDEALAGFCTHINITIHDDSSVTVEDNGRGIPVGPHPAKKDANGKPMETVDVVMTVIGAGGKFGQQNYKRGVPQGAIKVVGKVGKDETGTKQTFKFDKQIFTEDIDYRFDTLVQRFREMAFVTRGVRIRFVDERNDRG